MKSDCWPSLRPLLLNVSCPLSADGAVTMPPSTKYLWCRCSHPEIDVRMSFRSSVRKTHFLCPDPLYKQRLRAAPASKRDLPQGDQRLPLRVAGGTYAAFRSVVSTAKANRALVLGTVRFGLSTKRPGETWAGAG